MSIDLTTHYGRLKLVSPIIVGACPLTGDEQMRAAMEAAGAGALVLPSLFQEQVILWNEQNGVELTENDRRVAKRSKQTHLDRYCEDAATYLSVVNRASVLSSIPIIASLNGECGGNWLDFAGELQEAGASAIELNVHASPPREFTGPRDLEDTMVHLISTIGKSITVPVYLKLSRELTSPSHLAHRLLSGADGLVLFGRSPDVDISLDTLHVKTHWHLTAAGAIAGTLGSILKIHSFCPAMPLAACGGIGTADDVVKALLAGADVAMITSAIYRDGPGIIQTLIDGVTEYMASHQWTSIQDIYENRPLEFATEEERLDYVKALSSRPQPTIPQGAERFNTGDRWGHLQ
ncbi:MAG: dihydroorotate dehydrogenase [Planctomycetaceae bacterium]